MKVFEVGEFCRYEGGGWSVLVEDNDQLLRKAKDILADHHDDELKGVNEYLAGVDEDDKFFARHMEDRKIKLTELLEKIRSAENINDLVLIELPNGSDEISICEREVK